MLSTEVTLCPHITIWDISLYATQRRPTTQRKLALYFDNIVVLELTADSKGIGKGRDPTPVIPRS